MSNDLLKQIQQSLTPLLTRIDRVTSEWLSKQLAGQGVSVQHIRIIEALLGEGEGIAQNVLAKRLGIEQATLSITLSKLEAKGIVERYQDAQDTRIRRVTLSKRSSPCGDIKVLWELLENSATTGLLNLEIATTKRVLQQVEKNLSASLTQLSDSN